MTLPGTVQEVIETKYTGALQKAEIRWKELIPLYEKVRIENTLRDERGNEITLKAGAEVRVEAELKATIPKSAA